MLTLLLQLMRLQARRESSREQRLHGYAEGDHDHHEPQELRLRRETVTSRLTPAKGNERDDKYRREDQQPGHVRHTYPHQAGVKRRAGVAMANRSLRKDLSVGPTEPLQDAEHFRRDCAPLNLPLSTDSRRDRFHESAAH